MAAGGGGAATSSRAITQASRRCQRALDHAATRGPLGPDYCLQPVQSDGVVTDEIHAR
jgi:hypothetical protein